MPHGSFTFANVRTLLTHLFSWQLLPLTQSTVGEEQSSPMLASLAHWPQLASLPEYSQLSVLHCEAKEHLAPTGSVPGVMQLGLESFAASSQAKLSKVAAHAFKP